MNVRSGWSLKLLTPPATEPVTLADAKARLHVDDNARDDDITKMIVAARKYAEEFTERSLITQTWVLTRDNFPSAIRLDRGAILGVDSVKYLESDAGVLTPMDQAMYVVDMGEPGWVQPAYRETWPPTWPEINAVRVQYQAGYGAAVDVPAPIVQAILMIVGTWLMVAEDIVVGTLPPGLVPLSSQHLLAPYRLNLGV